MNTRLREAVSIEKRVAVALWRLATGNSYRTVSSTFSIGKSTAIQITNEFIDGINALYGDWIKFPETVQETAECIDRFQEDAPLRVPQIVAAIDGSHIPIKAPKHNKEGYFNRKHFYSIILQGVVGADGRFLDVSTGFPGSIHDARVLRMSGFFGRAQRGEILQGPVRDIAGIPIGPLIAADSAYPGLSWLVKPYQNTRNLERSKIRFNTLLSKARVVVERTFGILKGRWRCLHKELEVCTNNVPKVIVACCILHNICIMMGEEDPELEVYDNDNDGDGDGADNTANAVRDALRRHTCEL